MASYRALMTGTFRLELGHTCMTLTLDPETKFLEVLEHPRSTQLQVKCILSKD